MSETQPLFDTTASGLPWLSVLMPIYNGERYVRRALDSVLEQRAGNLEVIVVDNGSTDRTLEIVQEYAARLPLRVFTQPHAESWLRGANAALSQARGEFICMLHDDDWWRPGRHTAMQDLSLNFPTADILATPVYFVDSLDRELGRWNAPITAGLHVAGSLTEKLLIQSFFALVGLTVRRSAMLDAGGLDERLWYSADWHCWLTLCARHSLAYSNEPFASYRIHQHSQTSKRSRVSGALRAQLLTAYEPHAMRFLESHPERGDIDRVARFSIDANSALAALARGDGREFMSLPLRFISLGPNGWRRYFRDSCIFERVRARIAIL